MRLWGLALLLLALAGCRQQQSESQVGFYFWKSNFKLNEAEQRALDTLGVARLFVKFLDVDVGADGRAFPKASVRFEGGAGGRYEAVPCVFITNRTFQSPSVSPAGLAESVWDYLQQINKRYGLQPAEYQFDCDWTPATRGPYFDFLRHIRRLSGGAVLSATIRLHQYRYPQQTGLPPVDKGALMYYNMGDIADKAETNSILNNEKGLPYLQAAAYPLPLDVALPLFSWALLYRLGELQSIINIAQEAVLEQEPNLEKIGPGLYEVKQNFYFEAFYLNAGDRLRFESPAPEELERAADALHKIQNRSGNLIFYHLDEQALQNFPPDFLHRLARRLGD